MTVLSFPAPDWPTLPVLDSDARLPVRRVFCVGRNYAAHAAEMGAQVQAGAPFYFTKSALAVVPSGRSLPYPPMTQDYHHEVELVVAIGKPGFRLAADAAMEAVFGYGVGLDMTRRDVQALAKSRGHPWDMAKDGEGSAVIGPITPAAGFTPAGQRIALSVNDQIRQDGVLSDMVWPVPALIADLSRWVHLAPGDLILTGTPAGVGPVAPGDRLCGRIPGLAPVSLTIGPPE